MVPADGNFTTAIQRGNHKAGEVQGQTRQHARLINLLGVKQIIIGVNKMDCDVAKYSKSRFDEVSDEMKNMLGKVGYKKDAIANIPCLPISGWQGDNLIEKSTNMDWWKGQDVTLADKSVVHIDTLLDALDKMVTPPPRDTDKVMRLPISGIYKIKGVGDVLAGRVEQGKVMPNTDVMFIPTHTAGVPCEGKVFTVEMHHKRVDFAAPGDNVGMNVKGLDKNNMPHTGDVMVLKTDKTLRHIVNFTAQVQTLEIPGELKPGYSPIGFVRCGRAACKVKELMFKKGKETGGKKMDNPHSLKSNEMAQVVFEPLQPFILDSYKNCEGLSRIAFLDGNTAVMLGKVVAVETKDA
jgi:elongation factor 1-alpha